MSAKLRMLIPEATRNYVVNPAARYDTTYINAFGSVVTRTLDYARFGVASYRVVTGGAVVNEGLYYRTGALEGISDVLTVSAYVMGSGEIRIRLIDNPSSPEWKTKKVALESNRWKRIEVTGRCSGSNDIRLYVETADEAQEITFYVDGLQIERKAYSTTYCDGDQPGCLWSLVEHNSQSIRSAYTREGGRWTDIAGPSCEEQNLYMTVAGGFGSAPIVNQVQSFADAPGDYFQSTKVLSRVMTLTFHAKRDYKRRTNELPSLRALHDLRQQFLDVIKPDRTAGGQPFLLEYQDGDIPLYIWVRYDGGLEGEWDVRNEFVNSFPVRLLAVSPYWLEDDQQVSELEFGQGETINYITQRINGEWSEMNGGFDNYVYDIAIGTRGEIIAVGTFTKANNSVDALNPMIPANRIAWWDGESWNLYGTGANGPIYSVDVAPNGYVYVAGDFTSIGGVAINNVAYWDGISWNQLGAGISGLGRCVRASPDGNIYVGADIMTLNGMPTYNIARYDGNGSWHSMGQYRGLDNAVRTIGISLDGTKIYVGGAFTDEAFSPGTPLNYVTEYDTATDTFNPMGAGFDNAVWKLLVLPSGNVYACGDFTQSSDAVLTLTHIAYWNGQAWFPIGAGANGLVYDMSVSPSGNFVLGGQFNQAGPTEADYIALLNGQTYINLDIAIPNFAFRVEIDKKENLFVSVYGTTAQFASITTVENVGTAEVSPTLYIVGPARLIWLENQTTRKRLYTNLDIYEDEEITVDFAQGTMISNTRGNLAYKINPGSDLRAWTLVPGENKIAMFMTNDVDASAHLSYVPRHWSVDASGKAHKAVQLTQPQRYYEKIAALGPIAHWPLWDAVGATAVEELIGVGNGTPTSITFGQDGIGDGRTSAGFDGAASEIDVQTAALAAAFNGAAGSVVVWGQVDNAGVWTDGTARDLVYLYADANNFIEINKSGANNTFLLSYKAGGTTKTATYSGSPTTFDVWVITWDKAADQVKAFHNGSQIGATQTGLGVWAGALTSSLIGQSTTPGRIWSGLGAHVAVWTRALTPSEILSLVTV